MTNKQTKKPQYPKPISKGAVLKFASTNYAARPMIFWEKAKIWDWHDLLRNDDGTPDKDLLLRRLSELHIHFSDDAVPDNKRSMVIVVKVTIPTQREWLRLCEKYGYDTDHVGHV